jgi:site-specific recombinase XerD
VAASQRPKSTSTNKQGAGDEAISAAVERYTRDLERAPLAVRTRDAYGQHVGAYGAWLAGRPEPGVAITEPRGRDHAARDFKRAVRAVATRAGLELSAHVLRHTCVTNLGRSGNDLVLVAELAGHRRLETTRRYSLPSAADRQAAMDGLEIEP